MHFYSWKSGLKTGMYYLRTRPAVDAIKFTVNVEELLKATDQKDTSEILKVINKFEHNDEVDLTKKSSSTNLPLDIGKKDSTFNLSPDIKYEKKVEDEGCISCSG